MWILLLIQMYDGTAELHYLELYETQQQCLLDMEDICSRIENHEALLCMEANTK